MMVSFSQWWVASTGYRLLMHTDLLFELLFIGSMEDGRVLPLTFASSSKPVLLRVGWCHQYSLFSITASAGAPLTSAHQTNSGIWERGRLHIAQPRSVLSTDLA